ncbi:sugar-binding transcriptional regulator [Melghirimyces algeriensis]|uniref:sugar-binding transcriptional regulator n=1 Tax=Melghirimyces algeriensis TaxID=910412 RepID=UPI00115C268E|nr:sugar-binding transcriptional regulator [Melghirimyces algeriensis]
MKNREEERLLIKIARMYYEEGMTQGAIAKELGIYRTTIGRMLKKAREKGIVTITIRGDSADRIFDLEYQLEKTFQLKEAIIVPSERDHSPEEKKKAIGRAGADLLKRIVRDHDVVGFAWGSTLAGMVGQFSDIKQRRADFVPLVGGPGTMDSKYHVNTIVYNVANAFGGTTHFIDAAAIVEKKETRDDIMRSHYFRKILDLWRNLTIAVVGIGAPISSSNMIWTGFFGDMEIQELNRLGAIGEICSRYFDREGNLLHPEVNERTVAIELDRLKNLKYSIGMAESVEKVPSIIGAMKGRYINVLISNEETAEAILNS